MRQFSQSDSNLKSVQDPAKLSLLRKSATAAIRAQLAHLLKHYESVTSSAGVFAADDSCDQFDDVTAADWDNDVDSGDDALDMAPPTDPSSHAGNLLHISAASPIAFQAHDVNAVGDVTEVTLRLLHPRTIAESSDALNLLLRLHPGDLLLSRSWPLVRAALFYFLETTTNPAERALLLQMLSDLFYAGAP